LTDIKTCLLRAVQLQDVSDSARLDVELLLAHVFDKDRSYFFSWPEKELTSTQLAIFEQFFARRLKGEPIAYILGEREFWSLSLQVNASTLIPRPDTELLVEMALELFSEQNIRVLDLGTGTGAIALALASEKPLWHLFALDQSQAACDLAESNRKMLGIDNVQVLQSNWFSALTASELSAKSFDLIVSNPPYIDKDDHHLSEGDVSFEPLSALVADDAGLADIKHITAAAIDFINPGGYLLFEHGYNQAAAVRNILMAAGFASVKSKKDLNGNDRATLGCWPS
jgi:release factor glutamine methyltransferase